MKKLLADLLEIPERVHRGDFVMSLAEGVSDARRTLHDYVVTEQLAAAFDGALAFIRGALDARSSKATYLHGSFGSGKSHFMAVLHLLLSHNPDVRAVDRLAPVVAKHDPWLDGKRFLLVPFHMIGAVSMEAAIFKQYIDHVSALHPGAPVPGVYLAERIFEDAERIRRTAGDERFFAELNQGKSSGGDGWGDLDQGWTAASFDEALHAPMNTREGLELRQRLVGDLVSTLLQAHRDVAAAGHGAYVGLDQGLAILSRHARSLGYDAVIFFLDELILWLASHATDMSFVTREGQKLVKLVEAANADRPAPIVSFVARQRDLRDLVGEHIPGAEQLRFAEILKHMEGRFHTINLEDRNLPEIVHRRILRPRNEAARQELSRAFEESAKVREEVLNVLLTSHADRAMFEKVYPFSPALINTLVAVSGLLQRERTALRILLQLLVHRRHDLALGDIVPVGDLWDVIAEGDEPFLEAMRRSFGDAKKLYVQRLRPLLEREHGLRWEDVAKAPEGDAKAMAWRADDRILKTLLLGALVPNEESLRSLTPGRLAALNHGSIRSPIPGREGQMVLAKCMRWNTQVSEVRVSLGDNPVVQIQLTGVDTDLILAKAESIDNAGNRRLLLRRMLFERLGIQNRDELFLRHEFFWRGTRRSVEVLWSNVRELASDSLFARGDEWRIVIDFPFDAEGHSAKDDKAKIEDFVLSNPAGTRTVCWLPAFFSKELLSDLGTLVRLDHILTGERFESYSSHLSTTDRAIAKSLLETRKNALEARIGHALDYAYGVTNSPPAGLLDTSFSVDESFFSLDTSFDPQRPVGANLGEAFQHLLGQMLAHQYPGHPAFETKEIKEIKTGDLKKVLQVVRSAIEHPEHRVIVERADRPLMRLIANPLRLGDMTEGDAFLPGDYWNVHFRKMAAQTGSAMTVARLRSWIDQPKPAGLPRPIQNLVILCFADQSGQGLYLHNGPGSGTIESIEDEIELREQKLPSPADWKQAIGRVARILGITASPLPTANNLGQLAADIKAKTAGLRTPANDLVRRLQEVYPGYGIERTAADRWKTAAAALSFVETMHVTPQEDLIAAILRAPIATNEEKMAHSLTHAGRVVSALHATRWDLLDAATRLVGERAPKATALRARIVDALQRDELALPLDRALREAEQEAVALLTVAQEPPREVAAAASASAAPTPPDLRVVESDERRSLDAAAAGEVLRHIEALVGTNPDRRLTITWRIEEPTKK